MARTRGLVTGLLVVVATAVIACAGEPALPVPNQPATPTAVAAAPQSNGATSTVTRPAPTATTQPVPTPALAVTLTPATDTPGQPASAPTSVPQPTGIDSQTTGPERFLIRLKDDLDDPLGYCVDVRGFGSGIRLDADLQAHSCKSSTADDQAFAMVGAPLKGSIVLVDYGRCLRVADRKVGATILLRSCADGSVSPDFEWLPDGRLRLLTQQGVSQPMLCVGVANGAGEPAGGRNHLRRDLLLLECHEAEPKLIMWKMEK